MRCDTARLQRHYNATTTKEGSVVASAWGVAASAVVEL